MFPERARLFVLVLALACACGGGPPPGFGAADEVAAGVRTGRSPALERIVCLGASMTAGFGAGTTFGHALEAVLPEAEGVEVGADLFFFSGPRKRGVKLVDEALAKEPTLVIALDFPFWYGYGDVPVESEGEEAALRRGRLDEGLAQLERFTCPVVVGDFPDMQSAIGHMLRADQVPSTEVLAALNGRVRSWANEREGVHLLRWSETRELLREVPEGGIQGKRFTIPEDSELLLMDNLHPSVEGQVAVALWAVELLEEVGLIRAEEALVSFEEAVERLNERKADLLDGPNPND